MEFYVFDLFADQKQVRVKKNSLENIWVFSKFPFTSVGLGLGLLLEFGSKICHPGRQYSPFSTVFKIEKLNTLSKHAKLLYMLTAKSSYHLLTKVIPCTCRILKDIPNDL